VRVFVPAPPVQSGYPPENAAASVLWPSLRGILADYPGINVEVSIENGPTDIVLIERLRYRQ
jgi:hypothetical protein